LTSPTECGIIRVSRGTGHKKLGIIRQRADPKKSKKILENLLTNPLNPWYNKYVIKRE
jgi:hypothetical protein